MVVGSAGRGENGISGEKLQKRKQVRVHKVFCSTVKLLFLPQAGIEPAYNRIILTWTIGIWLKKNGHLSTRAKKITASTFLKRQKTPPPKVWVQEVNIRGGSDSEVAVALNVVASSPLSV
jgi:hypothetical protein